MKAMRKSLQLQHLHSKMSSFASVIEVAVPPTGWITAIRKALGMSLEQLARKLSVTKQNVFDIESREKQGSVTLKSLKEIARALDMQFVYGFVPLEGSLDALIEQKARRLAKEIVLRTSNSMALEDQANGEERIEKAIEERTQIIIGQMPKILWD